MSTKPRADLEHRVDELDTLVHDLEAHARADKLTIEALLMAAFGHRPALSSPRHLRLAATCDRPTRSRRKPPRLRIADQEEGQ